MLPLMTWTNWTKMCSRIDLYRAPLLVFASLRSSVKNRLSACLYANVFVNLVVSLPTASSSGAAVRAWTF